MPLRNTWRCDYPNLVGRIKTAIGNMKKNMVKCIAAKKTIEKSNPAKINGLV